MRIESERYDAIYERFLTQEPSPAICMILQSKQKSATSKLTLGCYRAANLLDSTTQENPYSQRPSSKLPPETKTKRLKGIETEILVRKTGRVSNRSHSARSQRDPPETIRNQTPTTNAIYQDKKKSNGYDSFSILLLLLLLLFIIFLPI